MSSPHLTSWMKVCVHVELHYSLYQLCFFAIFIKRQLDYKLCCLRVSCCVFDIKIWDAVEFQTVERLTGLCHIIFRKPYSQYGTEDPMILFEPNYCFFKFSRKQQRECVYFLQCFGGFPGLHMVGPACTVMVSI